MNQSTLPQAAPAGLSINLHGADVRTDGSVRFRLWAPGCERIAIELEGSEPSLLMDPLGAGWHELVSTRAVNGTRYRFVLPNGLRVPDAASRFQPQDVHGPSEVIDFSTWAWTDAGWQGRPWHEAVIYELHIGTFTPEGTFHAAAERLDHIVSLGATAIQLMPIGDFPGRRNWGYDGVLPYAPDSSYGRPEDLKHLIEAAHERGLMVLLDVVYNHFGPEGNYLSVYAPAFFTERHKTPWGPAINFDGPSSRPIRDFFLQNACHWLQHYHFDGLRLDAVHTVLDDSPTHILDEIAKTVREAFPKRQIHLILENEANQSRYLKRDGSMRPRLYTAQWNDDVHHALHTAATHEDQGYYGDYCGDTAKLGRASAEGFAFQGEVMRYRGSERGERSGDLPPVAFISFLQNHDQIGNRAFGERLGMLCSPEALRAVAAVYLLMPQIPMLFMGEEWDSRSPFPFFCDFPEELGALVREGRRREFERFPEFQNAWQRARIPDPQSESTFSSAKLDWKQIRDEAHRSRLDWYRRILRCRQRFIQPLLPDIVRGGRYEVIGPGGIAVGWDLERGRTLVLAANLSEAAQGGFPVPKEPIWLEGGPIRGDSVFSPWTVASWAE